MNYKDTLLMPKTDFEMRGNLPKKEPGYVSRWQEANMYEKVIKQMKVRIVLFFMMVHHMQMEICIWDIC